MDTTTVTNEQFEKFAASSENPATVATDKNAGRLVVYRAANLVENLLLSIDGATEPIESSSDSKAFDGQTWQRGVGGVTLASL